MVTAPPKPQPKPTREEVLTAAQVLRNETREQTYGQLYYEDSVCALGSLGVPENIEGEWENIQRWVQNKYPEINWDFKTSYGDNDDVWTILELVLVLNDDYEMTFNEIADWLEQYEK